MTNTAGQDMNVAEEIKAGEALIATLPEVLRSRLIGSAAFMPAQAADVDFAVLIDDAAVLTLREYVAHHLIGQQDFEMCGDYSAGDGFNEVWTSVRRGNLNLMVTDNEAWFAKYTAAMEVCKYLQIGSKDQRIAICRIVRDGWTAEMVKSSNVGTQEDLFS